MGEENIKYKLRSQGLNSVDGPEEKVILDENSEKYFTANPAGSIIWDALNEPRTASELADLLVEEFEIDHSTATRDVETYLARLTDLHMVDVS